LNVEVYQREILAELYEHWLAEGPNHFVSPDKLKCFRPDKDLLLAGNQLIAQQLVITYVLPPEGSKGERPIAIALNPTRISDVKKILDPEPPDVMPPVPAWFGIAGVCFATVTVVFLMYVILAGPALNEQKNNLLNILIAFLASASGAFLGGSAAAHGKIPFFNKSPIQFSAYGGIGIFVIVFLILHYANKAG